LEEDVFSICCVLAVAESERDAGAMAEGMVREWEIIDDLAMVGLAKIRQDCCDIL